jgi:hypothetical protein
LGVHVVDAGLASTRGAVHGNSTTHAPVVGSQHAGFSSNTAVCVGLVGPVWNMQNGFVLPAQSPVLHITK